MTYLDLSKGFTKVESVVHNHVERIFKEVDELYNIKDGPDLEERHEHDLVLAKSHIACIVWFYVNKAKKGKE